MAHDNMNDSMPNQGTNERLRSEANQASDSQANRAEEAKAELGRQHQDEKARSDEEHQEKSAIGGRQSGSRTGEPGRARDELGQDPNEPAGR